MALDAVNTVEPLPPAPEERLSPAQLQDIAGVLADYIFFQPNVESLWGLHQSMLMGEGEVLIKEGLEGKDWALQVLTTQGDRFVLLDGSVQEILPEGAWHKTSWKEHGDLDPRKARQAGKGMAARGGVGLLFEASRPLSEGEGADLVEAMWGFSCHPYLGRRIVADLNAHGRRAATVMPHLLSYMELMQEQFGHFGVSVRQCWPMPSRGKPEVPEEEREVPMPLHRPKLG